MHCRLGMEGEDSGTSRSEVVEVVFRPLYHQMHIQGMIRDFSQRTDHRSAECEIGNKVSVHDIDMEPLGSACNGTFHLFSQASQVSTQHTRSDPRAHGDVTTAVRRLTTRATADPLTLPTPAAGRVARTT